jgi:hypothetical protein
LLRAARALAFEVDAPPRLASSLIQGLLPKMPITRGGTLKSASGFSQ